MGDIYGNGLLIAKAIQDESHVHAVLPVLYSTAQRYDKCPC